jgi:1,4-alpha-glucan branching enzyme
VQRLSRDLNLAYRQAPALWQLDASPDGFSWIDANDALGNVLSFLRFPAVADGSSSGGSDPGGSDSDGPDSGGPASGSSGSDSGSSGSDSGSSGSASGGSSGVVACIANFSAVPHLNYRVGLPTAGRWREVINTDAIVYGGSGVGNLGGIEAEPVPWHGQPASAQITVPPLGVLWLTPEE